jgi:hypothetical protein
MDHLLDLEWTVVDEMDVALAGVDSPEPSPAAQPSSPDRPYRPDSPRQEHPSPEAPTRSPREPQPAAATQPMTPPNSSTDPNRCQRHARGRLRRSGARGVGGDNPYGRGPHAARLPRPESLCWRCGAPGHSRGDCQAPMVLFCSRCGTMGLLSRDCPCPRPPAAPLPRVADPPRRDTPNSPERPATPERAPCPLCGRRRRRRRRHRH